jgi:putative transcriptional regulator
MKPPQPPHLHLPSDVALEYANGNCPEATSLAAACHLTFCRACRAEVATCERMAESLLESLPGVALASDTWENLLDQLDAPAPTPAEPPAPRPLPPEFSGLPAALQDYLTRASSLRWRTLVPGAKAIDLPLDAASEHATARLLRFQPGFLIPLHDHAGEEFTVVFSGSITDGDELGERGDVLVRAPGDRHVQKVTDAEPCIALVVNEGPLVPLTMRGRLLKLITGV